MWDSARPTRLGIPLTARARACDAAQHDAADPPDDPLHMMNVYLVMEIYDYEGSEVLKVFADADKAHAYAESRPASGSVRYDVDVREVVE